MEMVAAAVSNVVISANENWIIMWVGYMRAYRLDLLYIYKIT